MPTLVVLGQSTHAPPHMGYHAKFDHSWSNGMSVSKEIRWKNWAPYVTPFNIYLYLLKYDGYRPNANATTE